MLFPDDEYDPGFKSDGQKSLNNNCANFKEDKIDSRPRIPKSRTLLAGSANSGFNSLLMVVVEWNISSAAA
jgi:hypothetical protein